MTATLENTSDMGFSGFSYESVDVARIPVRVPGKRGRAATPNPHTDVMARLAGSDEAIMFRLNSHDGQPWQEASAKRIVQRHTRWLRQAAHSNERSVRVHSEIDGAELRIIAQDRPYTRKPRNEDEGPDDGQDEGAGSMNDVPVVAEFSAG